MEEARRGARHFLYSLHPAPGERAIGEAPHRTRNLCSNERVTTPHLPFTNASSRPGTVCTQKQGGRQTMSSATITASAKIRVSDRQPDSAPTLHVAFLSEDGG